MPSDAPIIFSAPMIRALLGDRKTQTRRLIRPQPRPFEVAPGTMCEMALEYGDGEPWPRVRLGRVITRQQVCYRPGLRLWVRESVRADEHKEDDTIGLRYIADDQWHALPDTDEAKERHFVLRCYNSTDPDLDAYKVIPSIHMPRWASRITLTVTEVRVQRLHDISEDDAQAEGVSLYPIEMAAYYRVAFRDVWNRLHGHGAWDDNPAVVALTFTVERRNIDHV